MTMLFARHSLTWAKSRLMVPAFSADTSTKELISAGPLPPVRSFLTGDFAEVVSGPDQCWRFLGRKDRQIRRDGYRIELPEIENWLEEHIAVDTCFVTHDSISDHFVAYVQLRVGTASERATLESVQNFRETSAPGLTWCRISMSRFLEFLGLRPERKIIVSFRRLLSRC